MNAAKLYRGDTWMRGWALKNPAKQPIDLSGATARLHLRSQAKALIYAATTTNGCIIVDAVAGKLALTVAASVTATWQPGTYKFDLEITYPDGTVTTYESSALSVIEDQTHD